jgi:type VI protein secretion system component Hcp
LQIEGLSAPIAVQSYSLGKALSLGKTASKEQAGQFTVHFATGPASPLLLLYSAEGARFAEASLTVRAGNRLVEYTFANVSITSFSTGQGGDSIVLQFSSVKEKVTAGVETKAPTKATAVGYDVGQALSLRQQPKALKAGYDVVGQKGGPAAPSQWLLFDEPGGPSAMAVTQFSWSESHPSKGAARASDFCLTVAASADQLKALAEFLPGGLHASEAILTVGAGGQEVRWALFNVTIDSGALVAGGASLQLHFDAIQESVTATGAKPVTEGWNFLRERQTVPGQDGKATGAGQGPIQITYDKAPGKEQGPSKVTYDPIPGKGKGPGKVMYDQVNQVAP